MTKKYSKWIVVCGLILCMSLSGCGDTRGQEVILIGQGGTESYDNVRGEEAAGSNSSRQEFSLNAGSQDGAGSPVEAAPGETKAPQILVHVCGAVKNPGVVSLPEGSRAEDALLAAGGFAEDASQDYVNLAGYVNDGEKLYFPTEEEALTGFQEQADAGDGLVNINTADVATLCTLPGIGESRARDIISYREAHGDFVQCEDIMKVSGIKTSVYNKISDRIKVK